MPLRHSSWKIRPIEGVGKGFVYRSKLIGFTDKKQRWDSEKRVEGRIAENRSAYY
jgi:hypothetical protein